MGSSGEEGSRSFAGRTTNRHLCRTARVCWTMYVDLGRQQARALSQSPKLATRPASRGLGRSVASEVTSDGGLPSRTSSTDRMHLHNRPIRLTLDVPSERLDVSGVGHSPSVVVQLVVVLSDRLSVPRQKSRHPRQVRRLGETVLGHWVRGRLQRDRHGDRKEMGGGEGKGEGGGQVNVGRLRRLASWAELAKSGARRRVVVSPLSSPRPLIFSTISIQETSPTW